MKPKTSSPFIRFFQMVSPGLKGFLSAIFLLPGMGAALGQGTMYFEAHLTGNIDYTGRGAFWLDTNLLTYRVTTPGGFDQAQIRSPWPDTNAAAVFDLRRFTCVPPEPFPGTNPSYCIFQGNLNLAAAQVNDLLAGRWYVYSPAGPYFLSGQIVDVPEPAPASLLAFGSVLLLAFMRPT